MSKNRIEQVIQYIKDHPEKSGNQIYLYSKAHGFGIQKQKFYEIYRKEKIQSSGIKKVKKVKVVKRRQVSKSKSFGYDIPKKKTVQRKIIKEKVVLDQKDKLLSQKLNDLIEYPDDPDAEYGLIEVYDKVKKESYWIKYKDKTGLDWQIDKLEASDKKKGFSPDFDFIYHGLKTYTPFITPEFEAMMDNA